MELAMTSLLPDLVPASIFEGFDEVTYFHASTMIAPRLW